MQTETKVYQAGSASLFASAARAYAPDRCECCGQVGDGSEVIVVAGYRIPSSHTACKEKIERALCACYEKVGDNYLCPVHRTG